MTEPRLSVTIITFNEEARLRRCLDSVAWADEIVVVDGGSTDRTVAVAREYTDRVVERPWPGFAAQKNFALAQARGAWVLALDADEEVTPELRDAILGIVKGNPTAVGYEIARRNIVWGEWIRHGGLYPDWQLRLFRRGHGAFVARAVHEAVRVDGPVERLPHPLLHRSYRDLADFVARADRYSTLAAEEWLAEGRPIRSRDLVLRPLGRFLTMYVVRAGFLDGWRGLLLAGLYAYYVFMRTGKALERAKLAAGERRR
jgi:glycosyltransferase involved in cell wall biosynthesis